MKVAITKEIIFSYFSGTCSVLQKRLIEKWLRVESNREQFFVWLCEWEKTDIQYEVDVEGGLERHRAWVEAFKRNGKKEVFFRPSFPRKSRQLNWVVAATAFFCALLIGYLSRNLILFENHKTAFGEIRKISLKDKSKVVLNANSFLRVPRFWNWGSRRVVYLEGEANFEVTKSPEGKRFIVQTGDGAEIEVLGTVFNVYNREAEKRVVLTEGRVNINYLGSGRKRETIAMKPGELAMINKSGEVKLTATKDPSKYSAWRYYRFVFEDLTFEEVGRKLAEVFGTRIIFANEYLGDQLISGTFTAMYAEELMEVLQESGEFVYRRQGEDFLVWSDSSHVSHPEYPKRD